MSSIGGFGLERWTRQMGTQHNTWHIPHIAQKGSSPHDMSCPSKGITLCQSLIETHHNRNTQCTYPVEQKDKTSGVNRRVNTLWTERQTTPRSG